MRRRVDGKAVLCEQVVIELREMAAVHVENRPAALALEQEARVLVRVAAVLVAGTLIRHELVDKPLGG